MSLSKEPVYSTLKNHFVCGYRNIMGEPYAGNSGTHKPNGNAVETTNGAGGHNIQMFMMNPDGTVVHCLPGYWNAQDLSSELNLSLKLNDLYVNKSLSSANKATQYAYLQMDHVKQHPAEMVSRSQLQSFDMRHEAQKPRSDFVKDRTYLQGEHWGPESHLAFRTTDEVLHQRMSSRAFLPYGSFDVAKFADYGTHTYDKHEDSLDETGRMVAEGPSFVPIKNGKTMAALHPRMRSPGQHKVYVRTYGCVRPVSED